MGTGLAGLPEICTEEPAPGQTGLRDTCPRCEGSSVWRWGAGRDAFVGCRRSFRLRAQPRIRALAGPETDAGRCVSVRWGVSPCTELHQSVGRAAIDLGRPLILKRRYAFLESEWGRSRTPAAHAPRTNSSSQSRKSPEDKRLTDKVPLDPVALYAVVVTLLDLSLDLS